MAHQLKSYKARLVSSYHERNQRDPSERDHSPTPWEIEALRSLDYIQ